MPSSQQWRLHPDLVAFASGVFLPWGRGLHMESIRRKGNEDKLASLEPEQGISPSGEKPGRREK